MRAGPESLAAALLESDRAYFEAGADVLEVPGGSIAVLRGMESLAAGCVVQRIRHAGIGSPARWLAVVEREVRAAGAASLRMYLDDDIGPLGAALAARDAVASVEVGLVRMCDVPWPGGTVPAGFVLEPVESAADWCAKLAFHRACTTGPDGHAAPAELWVAMERRRAESGYLTPFLVRLDGLVCSTFALAGRGALARLKNLVVHPHFRGRGLARHVIRLAMERAAAGAAALGCFALERHHSLPMYRALGFVPVIRQREWVSPLPALAPGHSQLAGAGS